MTGRRNGYTFDSYMRRLATMGLLLALSVRLLASDDIGARIRAVAAEHNASVTTTASATYHTVVAYRSPRGYRTIVTLVDRYGDLPDAVTVATYETVSGRHLVTLLIDEGADGNLDLVYREIDDTLIQAVEAVRRRSSGESSIREEDKRLFEMVVRALREEVTLSSP